MASRLTATESLSTLPDPQFRSYMLALRFLVQDGMFYIKDESRLRHIRKMWLNSKLDVNWYAIDLDSSRALFENFDDHADGFYFIYLMDLAISLRFYIGDTGWKALTDNCISVVTQFHSPPASGGGNVLDEDTRQRLVAKTVAKDIFEKNPWLMVYFLIRFLGNDLFLEIKEEVLERPEPEATEK